MAEQRKTSINFAADISGSHSCDYSLMSLHFWWRHFRDFGIVIRVNLVTPGPGPARYLTLVLYLLTTTSKASPISLHVLRLRFASHPFRSMYLIEGEHDDGA